MADKRKRRTLHGVMTCGLCGKRVNVRFEENNKGLYRIHEYRCSNDLSIMDLVITHDDLKKSLEDENEQSRQSTDGNAEG